MDGGINIKDAIYLYRRLTRPLIINKLYNNLSNLKTIIYNYLTLNLSYEEITII